MSKIELSLACTNVEKLTLGLGWEYSWTKRMMVGIALESGFTHKRQI